jgi:hypothetical protein
MDMGTIDLLRNKFLVLALLAGALGALAPLSAPAQARDPNKCESRKGERNPITNNPRPSPEEICANSDGVSIEGGKCRQAVARMARDYDDMKRVIEKLCADPPAFAQAKKDCGINTKNRGEFPLLPQSQKDCLFRHSKMVQARAKRIRETLPVLNSYIKNLSELAQSGVEMTREYQESISKLERYQRGGQSRSPEATREAQQYGNSDVSGALARHANMPSSDISGVLEKFESGISKVTEQDIQVASPLVRDQLRQAYMAEKMRRDVEAYKNNLQNFGQEIEGFGKLTNEHADNMGQITEDEVKQDSAAGNNGAAGGGMPGMPQAADSGDQGSMGSAPESAYQQASTVGNANPISPMEGGAEAETASPSPGTETMPAGDAGLALADGAATGNRASLRERLREKLLNGTKGAKPAAEGASEAAATAAAGAEEKKGDPRSRARRGLAFLPEDALESFGPGGLQGMGNFALAGVATDATVKELVSEFEEELGEEEGLAEGADEEQGSNVGIGEDGEPLFQRMRAYLHRCFRNKCVTAQGNI